MDQNSNWSLNLGRWVNVPVRVHVLLLLFLTVIFCVEFNTPSPVGGGILSTAMVTAAILIFSIIVHELAHVFAIHNLGGSVESVMFMPWGGNSRYEYPEQKSAKLIAIMAGPFINFSIFMFGAILLLQSTETSFREIVHPFQPHRFLTSNVPMTLIKIGTWVNFQLLIANLLPCFPFDGAAALRTILSFFYKSVPQYRIESAVRVCGTAIAFTLIGLAFIFRDYQKGPIEPIWFLLVVGGICLYFAAGYSFNCETEEDPDEWDEAQTALGLSDSFSDTPSFFVFGDTEDPEYSKWLVEKQEARIRDEMQREQREIEQADDVLVKLHNSGIESLTSDEKLLLQRVSERLRRKRKLDVID